jgi:hypothetical protein
MAGKVTYIQPMGGNAHGNNNSSQLPQNVGARIMGAGNVNASGYGFQPVLTQSVAVAPPASFPFSKNRVFIAVSAIDSGNVGTMQPLPVGDVNRQHAGQYIMQGAMNHLAGKPNTLLNAPSQLAHNGRNPNNWHGDELTGIASWDYVTGQPTYTPTRGQAYEALNPITNQSGVLEPTPTIFSAPSGIPSDAVPGTLVFMTNGQVPHSSQYGPRHDG